MGPTRGLLRGIVNLRTSPTVVPSRKSMSRRLRSESRATLSSTEPARRRHAKTTEWNGKRKWKEKEKAKMKD